MNKAKSVWIAVAVAAVLAVLLFQFRPRSGSNTSDFILEPVKFVYKANGVPGAAAVLHGKTISEQELQDRSAVLSDLISQECKMLAEAAAKLSPGPTKGGLELFATDPKGDRQATLAKLKLPLSIKFSPEAPPEGVVRLNGKTLSREELNLNQVQYSLLKTRQFKEKLTILKDLFVNQLLFDSAKGQNLPVEKFIEEKIMKGIAQVSEQEIDDFALNNGVTFGKDAHEMRKNLRLIVLERKRNAAISEYVKKNYDEKVEIFFSPPKYIFPVNANKLIIESESPGATTILVFSDLQCTPCLMLARNLHALKDKYKKQIRVGFANFFTPDDWRSRSLAESAFCLNSEKYEYFWHFFELINAHAPPIDEATIYQTVKKTGADYEQIRSCLLKRRFKDEVAAQLKYASDFGVLKTPTVIIGGQVFTGPVPLADLEMAIGH